LSAVEAACAEALDAGTLPEIAALRLRFAPDPAALPEVVVERRRLTDYDALMVASGVEEGAA
jgi:hypothetical protein